MLVHPDDDIRALIVTLLLIPFHERKATALIRHLTRTVTRDKDLIVTSFVASPVRSIPTARTAPATHDSVAPV
jgi:hypothetical protein